MRLIRFRIKPILFLFFFISLIILILETPFFLINDIQINTQSAKIEAPMKEQLTGFKGKNMLIIFLFNRHYKQHIKASFPAIDSLHLKIALPSKLRIDFELKAPHYLFINQNTSTITAQDGSPLKTPYFTPLVENIHHLFIIRDYPKKTTSTSFMNQLNQLTESIAFHLPQEDLQLYMPNIQHITLVKNDTLPIKIGSAKDIDLKLITLKAFLNHHPNPENLEYIDLRIKNQVIIKPLSS